MKRKIQQHKVLPKLYTGQCSFAIFFPYISPITGQRCSHRWAHIILKDEELLRDIPRAFIQHACVQVCSEREVKNDEYVEISARDILQYIVECLGVPVLTDK